MATPDPGSVGFFICNHYMAGIHGGIQSLHAGMEMGIDFPPGTKGHETLWGWVKGGDPTAILLNGGFANRLEKVARVIEALNAEGNEDTEMPMARFHEGIDELNGALTAVCFVVPAKWAGSVYDREWEEVKAVLALGDPVDQVAGLTSWTMGDRLRLLRHGMPLRS
jgi:hypothetical protein